jgi:hypothetical protein
VNRGLQFVLLRELGINTLNKREKKNKERRSKTKPVAKEAPRQQTEEGTAEKVHDNEAAGETTTI